MKLQIIHNPRCSKSRETLSLIENKGEQVQIIDYLNGDLTQDLLEKVIRLLDVPAKDLLRTKEEEFQSLNIDLDDTDAVLTAILEHPKLLERPIVIKGDKAIIGRPPENVLALLS